MTDFKAKMHKIRFWLGPDPAGGAYSAPPDPLAGLMGPTSKGRGGEGGGSGGEGKGEQVTVEPGPLRDLIAMPLCHFFSNIDVASKYCLYYVTPKSVDALDSLCCQI